MAVKNSNSNIINFHYKKLKYYKGFWKKVGILWPVSEIYDFFMTFKFLLLFMTMYDFLVL